MSMIKKIILDQAFLGAIFSTVSIILLAYYLRKTKKLEASTAKALTSVLFKLSLPALAFRSFMTDMDSETLRVGLHTFLFGFFVYFILILLTSLYQLFYEGDKLDVMRGLTIFGATTFFGIPMIHAFLGTEGTLYANLFNVSYRVFLYSYGLFLFSGLQFESKDLKQIILNPTVLATFIGFFIWVFQDRFIQVNIGDWTGSFLRLDKTAPWFMQALDSLANLASPLAYLSIGMTLAEVPLKDLIKDRDVWIYTLVKLFLMPAIILGIMLLLRRAELLLLNETAIMTIVLMLSTPAASVAVTYAINFEKEALFASNAAFVSSVLAIFSMLFWILILITLKRQGVLFLETAARI